MSRQTDSSGAALRAEAARLNAEVVERGQSLARLDFASCAVAARDAALLKAIVTESLRWHHRIDWMLPRLLDRPNKRLDSQLGALLRIGLTQIAVLRIPDHAAVAATVAAADLLGFARARGFVNAVLRRYLRQRRELEAACLEDCVARFSHPQWLIDYLERDWPDEAEAVLEANNQPPPLWLRVNRTRISRDAYLRMLTAADIAATAAATAADAVLVAEPRPVATLPGFDAGLVSVQDVAAQRVGDLMQLAPGLRVLDACAAPGGKTALMRERCPGLADLVALDFDRARLALIDENLRRLGLVARIVEGSATEPEAWFDGARFDRILVDAPCSATGVIRRHPDIKLLRRPADIERMARRQAAMLDALWPLLQRGGRMVYVTCSVLRIENQTTTRLFAERTADSELAPCGTAEHLQVFPGETNADGFYYACVNKR